MNNPLTASNTNKLETFPGGSDTVLIAFDGSEQSQRAIRHAGEFLSINNAYILTVWEPIHRQAARAAGVGGMMQADWNSQSAEDDDPAFQEATNICNDGVALAQKHGFTTKPVLVESGSAIWSAIVDAAEELDVNMIVTGTRALTGWKSLLQSSVAEAIIKNSGRPVLIVPPLDEEDPDATDSADAK